jgi:type VI secretion system protein ImpH
MATFGWRRERSLADWLFAEPYRFDFFQAVHLLELMRPDAQPVGEGSEPGLECVRFHSRVSLGFPASDVHQVSPPADGESAAEMTVNFFGLSGPQSPLPLPFTELILERIARKDTGLRDFLDIFNHRLVSLMYRTRKVHRIAFTTKSPEQSAAARYLYSFLGLGQPSLHNRMAVRDRALLYYAGLLSKQPRSAAGLERMLCDHFQVKARLHQFQGSRRAIEPRQWTFLGITGQNQVVGESAVLGTHVWDQQGSFEVELGPLRLNQFLDFLPGGSAYLPLSELTRFYAGAQLEFSFRLRIEATQIPESRLGSARLGWTSWLKTHSFDRDDSQVLFSPGYQKTAVH